MGNDIRFILLTFGLCWESNTDGLIDIEKKGRTDIVLCVALKMTHLEEHVVVE